MKLYVTDNEVKDATFDTTVISINEFNSIKTHPFIASGNFDVIIVDICDKLQLGYVKYVLKKSIVIPKIVGELNSHNISLLIELYPEKSAELRFAMIRGKDEVQRVVDKLAEDNKWSQWY